MNRNRVFASLLAGVMLAAEPMSWAATVAPGEGVLHVVVRTSNGRPASDAMVWIGTHQFGRRRLISRRAGAEGRTTFVVPAGAFTVHARGTGGNVASTGTMMIAGQEQTMALNLHGYGGWWNITGTRGLGIHPRYFANGQHYLGWRALHRTIVVRREIHAAERTAAPKPVEKKLPKSSNGSSH